MELKDIYTPLEDAKKEVQRRWEDKELRNRVNKFFNHDIPDFLLESPKAHLVRHVSSLNFEFMRFRDLANLIGLEFVLPEFTEDKFISQNSMKYYLGRMFFDGGKGKNGGRIINSHMVIDFNKSGGKKFNEIKTLKGKSFVDFHHEILRNEIPGIDEKIKDISSWLKKRGESVEDFYIYYLALFIRNGVLFESFLLNDEEKELTEKVIIPIVEKLQEFFGVKPLIVRLSPEDTENDQFWYYYDEYLQKYIK